jgi:hypothetical protein
MDWYNKMWSYTVEFFRTLDVPVRTLECCSGDLADLKVKSCDIEAWSPRQQKYFEVGSCSTLGDAQARRLGIRAKGENGNYLVSTLNNTVLATPRGLIALLENNVNEDGSINVPVALRPYMGGIEKIEPVKKDIQELRDYMAKIDTAEKHKMDLIVSSYRYRLTQLCRLYLTRGYMTIGEYDQLNEFYHLYTGLGGNGEAKTWYDRAVQLPIHDIEE